MSECGQGESGRGGRERRGGSYCGIAAGFRVVVGRSFRVRTSSSRRVPPAWLATHGDVLLQGPASVLPRCGIARGGRALPGGVPTTTIAGVYLLCHLLLRMRTRVHYMEKNTFEVQRTCIG